MNKTIPIALLALIALVMILPTQEADASRGRGIDMINCINTSNPIPTVQNSFVSEWNYQSVVSVQQIFGTCLMKDQGVKYYEIPWMPVMYDIELIDREFNYTIDKQRITMNLDGAFELEYLLYVDIPYCLRVTSTWSDSTDHIKDTTTEMSICWSQAGHSY